MGMERYSITCGQSGYLIARRRAPSYGVQMPNSSTPASRSVLLTFRFVGPALLGSLAMALVCALAPLEAQVAALGGLVSTLGGLFLSYVEQERDRDRRLGEVLEKLSVPFRLARDPELFEQYAAFCRVLTDLAGLADPILRETAALKLASVNDQLAPLSGGTVVFAGTEGWRTVYEKLLASRGLQEYRSVALVRTEDYWRDAPGRKSMRANYDAVARGVRVERVVILRDELWPAGSPLPAGEVGEWIDEQHRHGVWVVLVREHDLAGEQELRADFGIYGDRAVGIQELDDRSRTTRFTLCFDPAQVRLTLERWDRLYLFGTPYQSLLDRAGPGA